jgi:hypothetical protein
MTPPPPASSLRLGPGAKAALAAIAALLLAGGAAGAQFGTPGGPPPANVEQVAAELRLDPYDLELLISFGTSKGGSAGHLALAIRDPGSADDTVYSANFYADRRPSHAKGFYTDALMARIPKNEYLFGTSSSLAPTAQFGLDFGEIYKRAVIGVRVYGVPAAQKSRLVDFFERINEDYRRRARKTVYHDREIAYDYLRLNCAKTIGSAFRHGAGYEELEVTAAKILPGRTRVVAALNANIPTEMAMKLMAEWNKRGYGLDVVLYKKYESSPYVDPHDRDQVAFKDLPNRFPSVLSRDFRKDQGRYRDYDNLFAMHLLYNLGKYSVRVNGDDARLEIEQRKDPMPYAQAVERAVTGARSDSARSAPANTHLYDFPR